VPLSSTFVLRCFRMKLRPGPSPPLQLLLLRDGRQVSHLQAVSFLIRIAGGSRTGSEQLFADRS
jgi:hypothetical protein